MINIHTIDPHLQAILATIAAGLILISMDFLKGNKQ